MTPEYFARLGDFRKKRDVVRVFEKRHVVETEDGFWVPIKQIRREPYKGKVYNLKVNTDESYLANGYAVHNCFMLAVVACVQYPPPMVWPSSHNVYETPKEKADSVAGALKASPDLTHALQRDLKFVFRKEKQQIKAVRGGY